MVNDSIPTQLAFKDSNLNRLIQSQPCYLITPKANGGLPAKVLTGSTHILKTVFLSFLGGFHYEVHNVQLTSPDCRALASAPYGIRTRGLPADNRVS